MLARARAVPAVHAASGIAIRAAAERSDRAATLGVPVGRMQTTVWVITTVLAFVTVFLRAGVSSFPIGSALGVTVLVRALAAAVLGQMDNFPRIAAAAIGLGIVEQAILFNTGRDLYVFPVLFVIIVLGLAAEPPATAAAASTTKPCRRGRRRREVRPIPTELKNLPIVRGFNIALLRRDRGVRAVAPLLAVEQQAADRDRDRHHRDHRGVTRHAHRLGGPREPRARWRSRPSAARSARGSRRTPGGTSASRCSRRARRVHSSRWPSASRAARAGGLTLAVTTLALAPAVLFWLLNPEFFDWVPRGRFNSDPTLFGTIEIKSQMSFYFLTLSVLALAIAIAYGIRRSRTGRVLIAFRENPRAAEAYGINALRTMLAGFAISGFLAAVAGVLFVHHQHMISQDTMNNPFSAESSLRVFAIVVIGGMASVPGAILGAVYVYALQYYMLPEWRFLATGVGLLGILLILPGGLGAGLAEARDAGLRWIARRRNIIVPSLLADRRDDSARDDAVDGRGRGRGDRSGPRSKRSWRWAHDDGQAQPTADRTPGPVQDPRRPRPSAARPEALLHRCDGRVRDLPAGRPVRAQCRRRARPQRLRRPRPGDPRLVRPLEPGLPVARRAHADRRPAPRTAARVLLGPVARARLAVIGALVWSVFGFATGLATTILMLVIVRSGAGMGRAVVTPTHLSLLSDYYPLESRTKVTASTGSRTRSASSSGRSSAASSRSSSAGACPSSCS